MDLGLTGRTAIVVASSRGIGRATAEALADEGANVVLCARASGPLKVAAAELSERVGAERVLAVPTDVARAEDVERLVGAAGERFGCVDILVANSGGPPPGKFLDADEDAWRTVVDGILLSAVRLSRAVLPGMREAGWGRIVFVTSTAAKQPLADLVLSNATRPGVHGLSKTLSQEFGVDGITVNCVCPGITAGTRAEQMFRYRAEKRGLSTDAIEDEIRAIIPLGRVAQNEDLAQAIAFLVSERASYITGESLSVDGGLSRSTF